MRFFIHRAVLALALLVPLLLATRGEACGPYCGDEEGGGPRDWEVPASCVEGHFGELRYEGRGCQVLGFLWLQGLKPEDQKTLAQALAPTESSSSADTSAWLAARQSVGEQPNLSFSTEASIGDVYFSNCLTGAFQLAADTLRERIEKFGVASPEVLGWAKAQDAVFAHCENPGAPMPEPAPADAPPLIRADRAYQMAAALFYAGKFDEAVEALDRIAADKASPWRGWAKLVAVRAVIRKSTLLAKTEPEKRELLEKARERCVAIVKDSSLKDFQRQTRQLTWFIDYRVRPEKQINLLGRALLEKPDANFGYALRDYLMLRDQKLPSTDELSRFLDVLAAQDGAPQAIAEWKKSRSLPWLVAALSLARGTERELPELLAQSESVPKNSPAYLTVHAHRGRLALAARKFDVARAEVLPLLESASDATPATTVQLLADILSETALTFEEWAKYAHRAGHGFALFTQGVPLARYKDPKMLEALSPGLRKPVVVMAWVRAVLLDRWDEEQALEPSLEKAAPELAADLAQVKARKEPDARKMAAVLLLLKRPGLSPFGGADTEYLGSTDICGTMGWCAEQVSDFYKGCDASKEACGTRFISPAERREVLAEREALAKLGKGPDLYIRLALELAKRRPQDELVPEALHESVKLTHYSRNSCGNWEEDNKARSALSKEAFQLLHRKYPKTQWAKDTPYHY